MLTPQEAESHVFSKASFGGGYNMGQVDAFLDTLIADYTALYKENAVLKNKMKVLVEKIEEYRTTEDAMRRTLLSAQKMADTMLREAEGKKAEAITKAEAEARVRTEEIRREIQNEEMRLVAAKNSTTAYVNKLKDLYAHELEYIASLSEMTFVSNEVLTESEKNTVKEIEDTVTRLMVDVPDAAPNLREPIPFPMEEEEDFPKPQKDKAQEPQDEDFGEQTSDDTLVFDRLQFGRDYDFDQEPDKF
ncbi:MAG: Cell division initiation protein DivIVA [Firmicutes bacterium]|nr:Cell division initiation protein DivIVA [Bacillota bacterium]